MELNSSNHKKQMPAKECMVISEKQFMRDHTMYSAISSWLFAIAGATNIGVLCALSSKVLSAAEQGKPVFKSNDPNIIPIMSNKKYNRIAIGMTAFGAVCMAVSNWLESKKVVTEWQLGAGKLQRKANIADERAQNERLEEASPDQPKSEVYISSVRALNKIPDNNRWSTTLEEEKRTPVKVCCAGR